MRHAGAVRELRIEGRIAERAVLVEGPVADHQRDVALALGAVDLVLVSHDDHPDNLDDRGRAVVLSGPGLPVVYVSGDNASLRTVAEISRHVPDVDVAVLFAGAARVPSKFRGRPLTLDSRRTAAAAAVLGAGIVIRPAAAGEPA